MADISKISPDDGSTILNIKDATARSQITDAYKVMGELGAKNCIPYPYTQSTQTINDVTFTVNSDGTIEVNGTASAETTFFLTGQVNQWSYAGGVKNLLKTGSTYILTDGDGAGTTTTYYLCCAMKNTNNQNVLAPQTATNATGIYVNTFTVPDQDLAYIIYIRVNNGVTLNNKVFKPMIRLASDSDSTYQPYAMTNKELSVLSLKNPTRLYSSDDLNNILLNGVYYWENQATDQPSNAPGVKTNMYLFVMRILGENFYTQVVIEGGWRDHDGHIYIRGTSNGGSTWSSWRKISDSAI